MTDERRKSEIKEAILETIVFFDIFSYPLTSFEIWRFLGMRASFDELEEALSGMDGRQVAKRGAFYFIAGREEIIESRNRRYNYSNRKMKRAIRISKAFRYIPWIRMIAIGNIIGSNNLKDGSDIDFFVISEKNRVWISRFFTTLITKVLFLRPRVNDVKDKICLSFYMGEGSLDLKPFHIRKGSDPYFSFWLAGLIPIYDRYGVYGKLLEANEWLRERLPNWQPLQVSHYREIGRGPGIFYREIIDLFIGGLEKPLKKLQLKILPNDLQIAMNKDTRVVITDQVMKLHVKDRRNAYAALFEEKLEAMKKEK